MWVTLAALGVLLVGVVRQAARPIADPDTFWHIRLGIDILDSRSLTRPTEAWTTSATESWFPHEWLAELPMVWAYQLFGLPGLSWLFGASLMALAYQTYKLCRLEAGWLAGALATGLAIMGMSASLSPRPQMVSFILLAVTLLAWLRTTHDLKPRWWLVPLMWVWACSHGMWIAGVVAGLAVTVGLVLDRRVTWRRARQLLAIPLLSLAVAALTPVGPGLIAYLFSFHGAAQYVTEWAPPSFRAVAPATTMAMIALVALTWARSKNRASWTHVALFFVATGWTLLYARSVVLGAIMIAPLAAATIQSWIGRPSEPVRRKELGIVAGMAIACLVGLGVAVPHTSDEPGLAPNALNSALEALPDGTKLINSYELGGWMHWRHPELDPTIDGMTDAYTVDALEDYGRMLNSQPGWDRLVDQNGAGYALIANQSPLAVALEQRLHWVVIGRDGDYALLRAPDSPQVGK